MTAPCARYEPDLSAFLDGELDAERRADVAAHLEGCAPCSRELKLLRGTSEVLRHWDAHETRYAASHGFRSRVMTSIGVESAPAKAPVFVIQRAAAAAVVVLAVGASAAIVVPSLRSDRGAATDLRAELAALTDRMNRIAQVRSPLPDTRTPETTSTESVLAPWEAVVTGPATSETFPAAPRPRRKWERVGDEMSLESGALGDYERFQMEKRFKGLEEKLAAREVGPDVGTAGVATAPPAPLAAYLGRVSIAERTFSPYESIQVWPLVVAGGGDAPAYTPLTVEEALRQELLVASESGIRTRVQVQNRDLRRPVLILAGDLLFGGRQDRVASNDVLVPPGRRVTIATRTSGAKHRRRASAFRSSGGLVPTHLRALVTANVSTTPWMDAVADTTRVMASQSRRDSLDRVFLNDVLMGEVERYVRQFTRRLEGENVVGLAVTSGSTILGAEVFSDHGTFRAMRARVLRSFLLEARLLQEGTTPGRDEVTAMLTDARLGAHESWSASGSDLGTFRSEDGTVFGGGLLDGTRPVHAVVFKYAARGRGTSWVVRKGGGGFDPASGPGDLGGSGTGTDTGASPGRGDVPEKGFNKPK